MSIAKSIIKEKETGGEFSPSEIHFYEKDWGEGKFTTYVYFHKCSEKDAVDFLKEAGIKLHSNHHSTARLDREDAESLANFSGIKKELQELTSDQEVRGFLTTNQPVKTR